MEMMPFFKGILALAALVVMALCVGCLLDPVYKKKPKRPTEPDPTPNSRLRNYNRPLSHSKHRRRAAQNDRSADIYMIDRSMYHQDTVTSHNCDTGRFSSGSFCGSDFGSSGGSSSGSSSSSSCGSDD